MWASILILVVFIMRITVGLVMHGKESKSKVNFWYTLITNAIYGIVLYYAGAFDKLINLF